MGNLIVDQFMTLDGVVQAPGGPDEDPSAGFRHGGWQFPYVDDEAGKTIGEGLLPMDALLLGRRTYDIFAGYWPKQPATDPFAKKLNSVRKYVASRQLRSVGWSNAQLLAGDLRREVERIKGLHKEVHVIGSAGLVQSLLRERLVDRFNLWLHPLLLGTGKRLFGSGTVPVALELVRSQAFGNGVLMLVYEPVGEPTYGDMGGQA